MNESPNHILTHKELLSLLKEIIHNKSKDKDVMCYYGNKVPINLVYKMDRSDFLKLWNRRGMKDKVFYDFVNYAVEKGLIVWDYMDSICFLLTEYYPLAIKIVKSDVSKMAPWVLPKRKGIREESEQSGEDEEDFEDETIVCKPIKKATNKDKKLIYHKGERVVINIADDDEKPVYFMGTIYDVVPPKLHQLANRYRVHLDKDVNCSEDKDVKFGDTNLIDATRIVAMGTHRPIRHEIPKEQLGF